MMKQQEINNIGVSDNISISDDIGFKEEDRTIKLTQSDLKSLNRTKYFSIKDQYKTEYILMNKKTGAIAAIRALSSVHACSFIGWRPKNVTVVDVVNV